MLPFVPNDAVPVALDLGLEREMGACSEVAQQMSIMAGPTSPHPTVPTPLDQTINSQQLSPSIATPSSPFTLHHHSNTTHNHPHPLSNHQHHHNHTIKHPQHVSNHPVSMTDILLSYFINPTQLIPTTTTIKSPFPSPYSINSPYMNQTTTMGMKTTDKTTEIFSSTRNSSLKSPKTTIHCGTPLSPGRFNLDQGGGQNMGQGGQSMGQNGQNIGSNGQNMTQNGPDSDSPLFCPRPSQMSQLSQQSSQSTTQFSQTSYNSGQQASQSSLQQQQPSQSSSQQQQPSQSSSQQGLSQSSSQQQPSQSSSQQGSSRQQSFQSSHHGPNDLYNGLNTSFNGDSDFNHTFGQQYQYQQPQHQNNHHHNTTHNNTAPTNPPITFPQSQTLNTNPHPTHLYTHQTTTLQYPIDPLLFSKIASAALLPQIYSISSSQPHTRPQPPSTLLLNVFKYALYSLLLTSAITAGCLYGWQHHRQTLWSMQSQLQSQMTSIASQLHDNSRELYHKVEYDAIPYVLDQYGQIKQNSLDFVQEHVVEQIVTYSKDLWTSTDGSEGYIRNSYPAQALGYVAGVVGEYTRVVMGLGKQYYHHYGQNYDENGQNYNENRQNYNENYQNYNENGQNSNENGLENDSQQSSSASTSASALNWFGTGTGSGGGSSGSGDKGDHGGGYYYPLNWLPSFSFSSPSPTTTTPNTTTSNTPTNALTGADLTDDDYDYPVSPSFHTTQPRQRGGRNLNDSDNGGNDTDDDLL